MRNCNGHSNRATPARPRPISAIVVFRCIGARTLFQCDDTSMTAPAPRLMNEALRGTPWPCTKEGEARLERRATADRFNPYRGSRGFAARRRAGLPGFDALARAQGAAAA